MYHACRLGLKHACRIAHESIMLFACDMHNISSRVDKHLYHATRCLLRLTQAIQVFMYFFEASSHGRLDFSLGLDLNTTITNKWASNFPKGQILCKVFGHSSSNFQHPGKPNPPKDRAFTIQHNSEVFVAGKVGVIGLHG